MHHVQLANINHRQVQEVVLLVQQVNIKEVLEKLGVVLVQQVIIRGRIRKSFEENFPKKLNSRKKFSSRISVEYFR